MNLQYFYRTIEKSGSMTGNKRKIMCCFSCAVKVSMNGRNIEQVPIEDDKNEGPECDIHYDGEI